MQPTGELCPDRSITLEQRGGGDALRRLLEINCFYILSAGLMMLGCFMLVRSGALEGTKFQRTIHSLLVLQAYEGLVIVTAAVIARRLLQISDVVTLLAIELVLLLDPTFFSNSIATFQRVDAVAVNAGCLMLVPVKLVVLARLLRIRITPGTALAFTVAGAVVYLSEAPLAFDQLPISHATYFLLLSWAPLLIASLLPTRGTALGEDERMTAGQRTFLERLIIGLPLFTAFTHFIESSLVHRIDLAPMLLAPTALALGLVAARNFRTVFALDAAVAFALLVSLTPFNLGGKIEIHATTEISDAFLAMHGPLMLTGVASTVLYVWFMIRHRRLEALWRIGGLGLIAIGDALVRTGVVGNAMHGLAWLGRATLHFATDIFTTSAAWVTVHPMLTLSFIALTLLIVALRWINLMTVFLAGCAVIVLVFASLIGSPIHGFAEVTQAMIIWFLVLSHIWDRPGWHGVRGFIALGAVGLALGRCADTVGLWPQLVLWSEIAACFAAAIWLRDRSYHIPGVIFTLIGLALVREQHDLTLHPAMAVIGLGLGLFAVGIWVSFNRDRLLGWIAEISRRLEPSTPMEQSTSSTETSEDTE